MKDQGLVVALIRQHLEGCAIGTPDLAHATGIGHLGCQSGCPAHANHVVHHLRAGYLACHGVDPFYG